MKPGNPRKLEGANSCRIILTDKKVGKTINLFCSGRGFLYL